MKRIFLSVLFLCTFFICSCSNSISLSEGDIIFQTSMSPQSMAIQLATNSKYSHMGIIFKKNDSLYVLEAVQPVKYTPLAEWIAQGEDGKYVVKRLKNAADIISKQEINKMRNIGESFLGKDYDLYFEWTDDKMYCSELVWKIYRRALGVEIGELAELRSFDLSRPEVEVKIRERFGDSVPLDEKVISPAEMFNSGKLVKVIEK